MTVAAGQKASMHIAPGLTAAQRRLAERAIELGLACWAAHGGEMPLPLAGEKFDVSLLRRVGAAAAAARAATATAQHAAIVRDGLFAACDGGGVLVVELSAERDATMLRYFWDDLSHAASDMAAIDGFNQQLSQSYEEVNLVYRMAQLLTGGDEPPVSVQRMCDELRATLGYGWLAMTFQRGDQVLESLQGRVMRSGQVPLDDAELVRAIGDYNPVASGKVLTAATHPLAARCGYELLVEQVLHDVAPIGLLIAGDRRAEVADISSNEIQLVTATASYLGLFHENAHRFAAQRKQFLGTLHALSAAVDAKDPYTAGHSQRVGLLASQLAEKIGLPAGEAEAIRVAGLLHDIGKIGVPEAVLRKPARLTDAEFDAIKQHPEIGYEILKDLPSLSFHLPGVLHHHERWDGRGYPQKLAGEAIPLIARILALADTFDAMSSSRAYRTGMERGRVLDEMRKSAGAQFDPALVEPFLSLDFSKFDLVNR